MFTTKRPNLARNNGQSGSTNVKELKKIIKDALYPEPCDSFSIGSMALATRVISSHEKHLTLNEMADLMLFYVECGTQFTSDFGDIDEDFYTTLEDTFQDFLKLIKKGGEATINTYRERITTLLATADGIGWGYGDQLKDLVDFELPEFNQNQV